MIMIANRINILFAHLIKQNANERRLAYDIYSRIVGIEFKIH